MTYLICLKAQLLNFSFSLLLFISNQFLCISNDYSGILRTKKKNQIRKFPDKGENALWGIISRYSYTNTNILLAQTQLQ